jgi:hypothetical protein
MKGEEFRRWAERGCRIYGDDPLFFLRELAQNARDAGARNVEVHAKVVDGVTAVLAFEDDGSGMSLAHARRFLFRLYASSKEGDSRSAGYYGIGFWSVLRFKPAAVFIESRPARGAAWGIRLDASLEAEPVEPVLAAAGTRVTLARPLADGESEESFCEAVKGGVSRYCRHLRRNDRKASVLPVRVNGVLVSAPIEPDGPVGLAFRRGPVEGAVGLGGAASVDLLARGLPVWRGTLLDELSYGGTGLTWKSEVARGLAPVFVLNGNDLAVVMARNAVIDDAALGRVRDEARDALGRLVEMHVGAVAGGGWWWRLTGYLRRLPRRLLRQDSLWKIPAFLLAAAAVLLLSAMGLHNSGAVDVWSRATPAVVAERGTGDEKDPEKEGMAARSAGPGTESASWGAAERGEGENLGDGAEAGSGTGAGAAGGETGKALGDGALRGMGDGAGPLAGAASAAGGTGELAGDAAGRAAGGGAGSGAGGGVRGAERGSPGEGVRPLATVPSVYRGATVDAPAQRAVLPLTYSPPVPVWFKFLTADHYLVDRGFVGDDASSGMLPYPARVCAADCIAVAIDIMGPGRIVLPCPTGYGVERESVRTARRSLASEVKSDRHGQAVVTLEAGAYRVQYTVGPVAETVLAADAGTRLVELPTDIDLPMEALGPLRSSSSGGVRSQVEALARVAGRLMVYDDSAVAARYYGRQETGGHWLQFVLSYGRGDCDVINAVAAVLLRSVGIPARLAVGAVGMDGRVQPGSHAWVEYFDDGWHAVDVSRGQVVRGDVMPGDVLSGAAARGLAGSGDVLPGGGVRGSEAGHVGATAGRTRAQGTGGAAGTEGAGPGEGVVAATGRSTGARISVVWGPRTVLPLATAAALLLAGVWLTVRHRLKERFRFGAAREEGAGILADMLLSAQAQPSAWRHAPSLWRARVLPVLGGGLVSLARAASLAGRHSLYIGTRGGVLAGQAVREGQVVLDLEDPHFGAVCRAVSGVVDLDRLDFLAPVAPEFEDRLLADVGRVLWGCGIRQPLLWCRGMAGRGAASFLVGRAGRRKRFPLPERFIGISPDARFVIEARQMMERNESLAVLHMVEGLVRTVESIAPSPQRLLADVARRLLAEGVR